MIIKLFNEIKEEDYEPIKDFYLKDHLCASVWDRDDDEYTIKEDILVELLQIANDYIDYIEIEDVKIDDIIFTGSLSNFNYSQKYSDFDIHIIFNFLEVDKNEDLVIKYLDTAEKLWKEQHDIKIKGYDVELYCQNSKDDHISTGQFSLLNNKWVVKPTKEDFEPDENLIKEKSGRIMETIDDVLKDFDSGVGYKMIKEKIKKVWKKIKDARKAGLEKDGEFSIENLVFKLLRRNGYIGKLLSLKRKSYDKQFK